ncbi:MAG: GntR family transcriptional regulator [Bifidobacteriaceae bacterium]|jgi:GntR family transcriptional regulator|nr:GntR family transcriptional regulator [Bifidobacteriaceae bacterium]
MTSAIVTRFEIDKALPIPLYRQLKDRILSHIRDGTLEPGDLLPSESELGQALGLSRPTIRQALSELALEGFITKEQGRGSFVAKPKTEGHFLSKLQSFSDEMRQLGLEPSTELLSLRVVASIPKVNDRLGLPLGHPLVELARLRSADAVPIVYVETYLPGVEFADLVNFDLAGASLYATLEKDFGAAVTRVTRTIEACLVRPREAKLLKVEPPSAICLVRTVAYADGRGPVEYSIARYRGDQTQFSLELYR